MRVRPGLGGFLYLPLWFLFPPVLVGQTCLGMSPRANRPEVVLGVEGQNEGFRIGGWAQTNVNGVLGVRFGASVGRIDGFADNGWEIRGLVSRSIADPTSRACVFVEYEQANEKFRDALGLTSGAYLEHWAHLGLAVAGNLAQVGEVGIRWHAAPELIWRVTHLTGRTIYVEPEVQVIVTTKQTTAAHLGGRVLLSARLPRLHIVLGLRTRPRRGSDILWSVHLGFPVKLRD